MLETARPREDGGDGVGGGGVALLVFAVVPGDRAVCRLRLDSLTVRAHKNGGHQAEGACGRWGGGGGVRSVPRVPVGRKTGQHRGKVSTKVIRFGRLPNKSNHGGSAYPRKRTTILHLLIL